MTRWAIGAAGIVMLAYGVVLAVGTKPTLEGGLWLAGGTLVHDAVLAPVVGLTGWLVTRTLPLLWRAPVAVGASTTGVLVLLALPELVRPYPAPVNPGLHDRDYGTALVAGVVVVWVLVLAAGIGRTLRDRTARR